MARKLRYLALLLLATACSFAQATSSSAGLTLAELARTARTYLRDSAEFPLDMRLSMTATSISGRTVKRDSATGRYDFHGYNPQSEHGGALLTVTSNGMFHSPRPMLIAARNSFLATNLPMTVLFKNAAEAYSLETVPSAQALFMIAKVSPVAPCTEFTWIEKFQAPGSLCGTSLFQLQKDDLSLKQFSFNAEALPVITTIKPFGKCELRKYHLEAEFQKVTLPDDPKPFLVPAHTVVTIETDKGSLRMITDFRPHK